MTSSTIVADVAIVGGGVAGSTLAIVLQRAGLSVAVIEREARFRDRVRGDALFPWGAVEASRLGIASILPAAGARALPIWQSYEDREPAAPYDWRSDVPSGDVLWGVDHPKLQEALIQEASAAGARVIRPAKTTALGRDASGAMRVRVTGISDFQRVTARLVVGADGKESGVRRWIGARTVRDPVHHLLGGCLVEGVALDPDASHVGKFDGGMALVFRHGSGRARAYLVVQPEVARAVRGPGAAERFIAHCATAFSGGAFERAQAVGPAAFFPAADIVSDRLAGDGVVLIGDAAGANDPALGQGLSLAFRDVRALSDLLTAEDDWSNAPTAFAARRPTWYEPLRAYAMWRGPLVTDIGREADAARERAKRAAEADPFRLGYGPIFALGPEGLPVTEGARRRYLGEDLEPALTAARDGHDD